MSSTTDAADEAGGEAIFASDGLESVPIPTKPAFSSSREEDGEDVLDSGDVVAPTEAFELFSGKLYKTTTAMTKSSSTETPLEKLSRLQRDVAELERDLQGESSATGGPEHAELTQLASSLSARLQAASSYSHIAQQDKLTSLLQSRFQHVHATPSAAPTSSNSAQGPDTATATTTTPDGAPVVYELYSSTGASGSTSGVGGVPSSNLEERLLNLERSIGSSTTVNKSVIERLAEFEKVIHGVDKKSLEQTTARAKVIRADMEAASKARTKLDLSSNSTEAKKINELYNLMEQLESVQNHLPALVQRLQQLSVLHNQTATFSSRLTAAEQSLTVSAQKLSSVQETLSKLETGMTDNVKVIEQNIHTLDERMKTLSS
eukprot:CAMPEP_0195281034 /NCGR_PEP_ID=MMETSP0707-20130614/508_1 /TAXON_ID=33640 /ORGANISM="Asterionellopsis glacialis, Strain CCMP134" /LENGTH=375 /DNA_ID=CAMNT_0040339873 /DNA_START=31 /DNA_END=1158 /DNA_ORIENTATION=-